MPEEIKNTEEKEKTCFCQSKAFRNFLTIAFGTFVGVYCALCLFAALHRPPMMPPMRGFHNGGCPIQIMHHKHHFDKTTRANRGDFQRQQVEGQRTPFEVPRPEINR